MAKQIGNEELAGKLNKLMDSLKRKSPELQNAGMSIEDSKLGLSLRLGADTEELPFHIASVGKLFTTVLIAQLVEQGLLSFESRIVDLLDKQVLAGLWSVKGQDYSGEATIAHLLSHTSGLADYFDGPALGGVTVAALITKQPERAWTPEQLIAWTRERQKPVGKPGQKFYYSDTGFVLLGLIVERLRNKAFHIVLEESIFGPLGMQHTWMPHRAEPKIKPKYSPAGYGPAWRPIWLRGVNVASHVSVTADWAGGGVVSTSEDLLTFWAAYKDCKLVSQETQKFLETFSWKFFMGIHYGYGLARLHLREFFPLLPKMPLLIGHSGITGTGLFATDDGSQKIVLSLGSSRFVSQSFALLIKVMLLLTKARRKNEI